MQTSLSIIILIIGIQEILGQTVNVSVYYESLCPDSMNFIDVQLFPTYKYIGNDMKVDLVPFGFETVTNESGKLVFTCQHGSEECYGNKIHGCAIDLYSVEESTEFIYCSMSSDDPGSDFNLETCANSTAGISWSSLQTCYTSGQADKILERNGIRTLAVTPEITFIPTIIFNDQFNMTLQNDALIDLMSVVCDILENKPLPCQNFIYHHKEHVKMI